METLAYIHIALAYDTYSNADDSSAHICLEKRMAGCEGESVPQSRKQGSQNYWQKRSLRAGIYLLSFAVGFAELLTVKSAIAVLKQGARGEEVRTVQHRLRDWGYFKRRPSGYFGPLTRDAVMRFQQENNLPVDGIVGEETQALLNKDKPTQKVSLNAASLSNTSELQAGDRGKEVELLQELLTEQGFDPGGTDGVFGPKTQASLKQFQENRGLIANGIAEKNTLAELRFDDYRQAKAAQQEESDLTKATQKGANCPLSPNRPFTRTSSKNPYVVVVPGNIETLTKVRVHEPDAFVDNDPKLGCHVNAREFDDTASAESHSKLLQTHQLDARVVYFK